MSPCNNKGTIGCAPEVESGWEGGGLLLPPGLLPLYLMLCTCILAAPNPMLLGLAESTHTNMPITAGLFRYGFEFMGLNGRLVITALTDR